MDLFLILISILFVLITIIYLSFRSSYQTWKKLNIPHITPAFPFGNFTGMATKNEHFGIVCRELYEKLKSNEYSGVYLFKTPALFITSPEFMKTVLVRDFSYFMNRGLYYNPKVDPLTGNIFFHEGDDWKILRQKLSFAFTSGKMKMMFHTLANVGDKLVSHINNKEIFNDNYCDIKELMACFTTDVISSCVFGLEANSLENKNSEFRCVARKVMGFSKFKNILIGVATTFRDYARKINFRVFDEQSTNFFYNLVHDTIEYRKKNNIQRNDIMQIMMEMMSNENPDEGLKLEEISANAFIFFFAGFETSSTTLTMALYYLASNLNIQNDARNEINKVLKQQPNGKLTYESLFDMHLIERIILETLRLFPPVASLHRIANKPYTLPNNVTVPAGTLLIVPVMGFHYDPNVFPDPYKFDPDRFTNEEKQKRHQFYHIPFGEGNRICIGQRFAIMQVKVGLINLLQRFEFCLSDKTEIPMKCDPAALTYVPYKSVWLKINKIDNSNT